MLSSTFPTLMPSSIWTRMESYPEIFHILDVNLSETSKSPGSKTLLTRLQIGRDLIWGTIVAKSQDSFFWSSLKELRGQNSHGSRLPRRKYYCYLHFFLQRHRIHPIFKLTGKTPTPQGYVREDQRYPALWRNDHQKLHGMSNVTNAYSEDAMSLGRSGVFHVCCHSFKPWDVDTSFADKIGKDIRYSPHNTATNRSWCYTTQDPQLIISVYIV